MVNVMTPYPGTAVFKRLEEEGRLLTKDWFYYDHKCVVFQPRHMSPEELEEGYRHVLRNFYSLSGVARHFAWSLEMRPMSPKRILFFLLWNLAARPFAKEAGRVTALPPNIALSGA